jgi:hypothetical protein
MKALLLCTLSLVLLLAAPSVALTFCQTYATALSEPQEVFMETVVASLFTAVTANTAPTVPYYAGGVTQNGAVSKNYIRGTVATANADALFISLTNFYGYILGCQQGASGNADSLFPNPLLFNHNLTAVNNFIPGITGTAFEFYNRALIKIFADAGVAGTDLVTVSKMLDSLRLGQTVASTPVFNASNVICQDAVTCPRGPFLVYLTLSAQGKYYLNPGYLSIPVGSNVTYVLDSSATGQHNILQDVSLGTCAEISSPLITCTTFPCQVTIAGTVGATLYVYDGYQCSGGSAFAEIGILPAMIGPTAPVMLPQNPLPVYFTDAAVVNAPIPTAAP